MKIEILKKRKGISQVVSALILSAAVLTIGVGVWVYSQGAMTMSSEYYAESVIKLSETISERFIIEHVAYIDPGLKVWVYNYGNVDIEVKIEVKNDVESVTYPASSEEWIPMNAGGFAEMNLPSYTATSGDNLVITAYTRRENSVYYRYIVP